MARKKTTADLVFGLPETFNQAILASMTPEQREALTGAQMRAIMQTTNSAAMEIAEVLVPGTDAPDPRIHSEQGSENE